MPIQQDLTSYLFALKSDIKEMVCKNEVPVVESLIAEDNELNYVLYPMK